MSHPLHVNLTYFVQLQPSNLFQQDVNYITTVSLQ